jgi:hypothetical protein
MGATRGTKNKAKRMYEGEELSYTAIGKKVGFSGQAVSKWAKDEGWVKFGSGYVPKVEDAGFTSTIVEDKERGFPHEASSEPEQSEVELRERLSLLEARNRTLEKENYDLKPTRELKGMFTDRVKWLTENSPEGERYWINRAEAEYKKVNIQRAQEGLPVFDVKEHPEILEDLLIELKTKESMHIDNSAVEVAARKIKLYIVRNGMPTIEQIPFENQINNTAGSLADGLIRYTQKGFKLTDPFLCPRAGCFKPAASDEMKRWKYDGYCTEIHRAEVEGKEKSPTAGLQTRDVLSGVS